MLKKHLFPPQFAKELSIEESEFSEYCEYLIKLFKAGGVHDAADRFSVKREQINSLARIALMLEKARAKNYEVDNRKDEIQKRLDEIKENLESEKLYIARGPKPRLSEQILIIGMSLFPGLSLGKMFSISVPIPILAIPFGLVFGGSFFWLAEQFILEAWKNVVFAPQLSPGKEEQLTGRAICVSVIFVLADAFITGISMVLSSIPEGGTIEILSWCWLIFSIVTSIIMTFILHSCATRNQYAVRRVLEKHRESNGVAIEKITAEFRNQKAEEKKLRREIKDLTEKSKVMCRYIEDKEKIRASINFEIFNVEYLERSEIPVNQSSHREKPQKPVLSDPGLHWAQRSASTRNGVAPDKKPDFYQGNGKDGNGKVDTHSKEEDFNRPVDNESPDARLY